MKNYNRTTSDASRTNSAHDVFHGLYDDHLRCYARQYNNSNSNSNSNSRKELATLIVKFHHSKKNNNKLIVSTFRLFDERLPSGTPIVCKPNATACVQLRAFILDPIIDDELAGSNYDYDHYDYYQHYYYEIQQLTHESNWISATVRMLLQLDGLFKDFPED